MKYCIKNYFIKNANLVADGSYIPKWQYDQVDKCRHMNLDHYKDLQNKLATIKRIATDE